MTFLCVNTSLNSCSINLVSENKNIICYEDKSNPPSDIISILVKESLESVSLQVSDISGIITIIGPGNYTSIRVGIAFSLGLTKSQSIPIYGISALEAIAITQKGVCKESENALVFIKALQNEYFIQIFNHLSEPMSEPIKSKLSNISKLLNSEDLVLIGLGVEEIEKLIDKKYKLINSENYIDFHKVLNQIIKKPNEYNKVSPLYLSAPVAEKKDISWFVKKKI